VVPVAVAALAEKGMRTMLLGRSKTLACALVLLGGSTAGVLAFAQRQKEQRLIPKDENDRRCNGSHLPVSG